MHAAPGVGLAAPQVGVEKRVAVVDLSVGEDPAQVLVLVNPVIGARGERGGERGVPVHPRHHREGAPPAARSR